jgi:hypothetical protein
VQLIAKTASDPSGENSIMRKTLWASFAVCLVLSLSARVRADEQADMKALIDKAVKAMGREEKLARFKNATWKGKGSIKSGTGDFGFTEDSYMQPPSQYRFDLEIDANGQKIKEIVVINGDKGWIKIADMTADLNKDQVTAFKDYFYAMGLAINPTELRGKGLKLSPLGEVKIGDRTAIGVQAVQAGRRDVNVYFDKDNGLPLKSETIAKGVFDNDQEVTHEFFYSDYKEFEGAKAATKISWKRDGKPYVERELTEGKPEEKLDESLFGKP